MGHAINYFNIKATKNRENDKKAIMEVAEKFAFNNVDRLENPFGSYHGNMHINETIFENEEKAYDFIEKYTRDKFYYDLAVRYYEKTKSQEKKEDELLKKRQALVEKINEYDAKHSIKALSSKLITCKECGSKVNVHHDRFRGNKCPICGTDLRASYITDKIANYNKDLKAIEKNIKVVLDDKELTFLKWLAERDGVTVQKEMQMLFYLQLSEEIDLHYDELVKEKNNEGK